MLDDAEVDEDDGDGDDDGDEVGGASAPPPSVHADAVSAMIMIGANRIRTRRPDMGISLRADHPLRDAVQRSDWTPRPAEWELLDDLEHELGNRPQARIALLVDDQQSPLGAVITDAYPDCRLDPADVGVHPSVLHATLAAGGPYDVIIDDTRRVRSRRQLVRNTWFHLRAGGIFVIRDVRPDPWPQDARPVDSAVWPWLRELIDSRGEPLPENANWTQRERWHRSQALGRVIIGTEHLIMENRTAGYAKMREHEMNAVIAQRSDDRAELIDQLPPVQWDARAELVPPSLIDSHPRYKRRYEPPAMSVRRYRDAIVLPHQVALQDWLVLPESYRHNQHRLLKNRRLTDLAHYFVTVEDVGPVRRLPGRYFHLDAEWRQHYGHLLTEQLSRLWAWPELKRRHPDLKAVVSLGGDAEQPKPWEQEIFAAAGVDPSDLVPIHGAVRVDELFGATPMMSMPDYLHPEITALWDRVGDRLAEQAPERDYPDRIFVTRPPESRTRPCHNQREVEDWFADRGYQVVRPELLPVAEQVRMFREASVITGFGGSALFTLMFRRHPATVVVLRPSSYTSVNEYMISAARGNKIIFVDSVPDVEHPPGRWTWEAFYSGFTFDFGREGRQLARYVSGL